MEQSFIWVLPASALGLGVAAGLYGWRLRNNFEREHPKLTRAALKAESRVEAEATKKSANLLQYKKVVGGESAK